MYADLIFLGRFWSSISVLLLRCLKTRSTVPVTAEVDDLCASRLIIQQQPMYRSAIVPNVSPFRKDQWRMAYMASTTTAVFRCSLGRSGTHATLFSSFRTFTRFALVLYLFSSCHLPGRGKGGSHCTRGCQ